MDPDSGFRPLLMFQAVRSRFVEEMGQGLEDNWEMMGTIKNGLWSVVWPGGKDR